MSARRLLHTRGDEGCIFLPAYRALAASITSDQQKHRVISEKPDFESTLSGLRRTPRPVSVEHCRFSAAADKDAANRIKLTRELEELEQTGMPFGSPDYGTSDIWIRINAPAHESSSRKDLSQLQARRCPSTSPPAARCCWDLPPCREIGSST